MKARIEASTLTIFLLCYVTSVLSAPSHYHQRDGIESDEGLVDDPLHTKDPAYWDMHYRNLLITKNKANEVNKDFWTTEKDVPEKHYDAELKEKKEKNLITSVDLDAFENTYGRYRGSDKIASIDNIAAINRANDVEGELFEADIVVDSPGFDYKKFIPTKGQVGPGGNIDALTTKGMGEANWGDSKNSGSQQGGWNTGGGWDNSASTGGDSWSTDESTGGGLGRKKRDVSVEEKGAIAQLRKRDAKRDREYLWMDKTVPYIIDEVYPEASKQAIKEGMKSISDNTCIKFVEKTDQPNWVHFKQLRGCFSAVGKEFWRPGGQDISLGVNCIYKGTIIHEIMHSLGFWHEQSRPDRNKYVEVMWENISPNELNNFNKYSHKQADVLDAPYDYGSVMHYGEFSFSLNGKQTLKPVKTTGVKLGQRDGMSQTDIQQINQLYDCQNKDAPGGWSSWSNYGPCDTDCSKKRTRFCTNKNRQACAGANYWGVAEEKATCPPAECNAPVDGHWGRWAEWGTCSVTCDSGTHTRTRTCDDPQPKHGGAQCEGDATDIKSCTMKSCSLGPNDCEFETNFCKFSQDPVAEIQWKRKSGKTPSSGTGPNGDHTSGDGNYIFIESSSPARAGNKARLVSPSMGAGKRCVDFYYNMYGRTTGSVTVYVEDEITKNRKPIFSKTGDQGQDWQHAVVDADSGSNGYKIIFEAERGRSYQSDIGLDDIFFKYHPCSGPSTQPPPTEKKIKSVKQLGCHNDFGFIAGKRPFTYTKDMRTKINWYDNKSFDEIVADCSAIARDNGWEYFAIEYFGECWSGPSEQINYARDGASTDCYKERVGKGSTMFAYKWN